MRENSLLEKGERYPVEIQKNAEDKYTKLQQYFLKKKSVAIAFSGGVDSTLLLKAAHDAIGERAFAVTAFSSMFPKREREEAEAFCRGAGCRQYVVTVDEKEIEGFENNPPNRCYLCKKALLSSMKKVAREHGADCLVEGSNVDDRNDYRPGLLAIEELEIESPLCLVGMCKEEIRFLLKKFGISAWKKPSFACLASRFVYGEPITKEKLSMVERGEDYLHRLGFGQYRVRIHGNLARIELMPGEFVRLMEDGLRMDLEKYFREIGFLYVTLDLKEYEMGSMNRGIIVEK